MIFNFKINGMFLLLLNLGSPHLVKSMIVYFVEINLMNKKNIKCYICIFFILLKFNVFKFSVFFVFFF